MDIKDERIRELESEIERLVHENQSLSRNSIDISKLNRLSEEKFRLIFDNAYDAMILWEVDKNNKPVRCLEVNRTFLELTGYNEEEARQLTTEDLRGSTSEHTPRPSAVNARLKFDVYLKCKSGKEIPTEVKSHRFELNGSKVVLAIHRDISDRRECENRLLEEKKKAEEADRLKSMFLANMSHEIRTPMNAIMGFSELLQGSNLTEQERKTYLDILRSKSGELLTIINDILYISRIEAGEIAITPEPVYLSKYLERYIIDWRNMLPEIKRDSVVINLHTKLEGVSRVMVDIVRLSQVLNNLVSNAIKFTDNGSIGIFCKLVDKRLLFEVEDTGIGISARKCELIFGRFRQADESKTRKYGGTGLGLSICKQLLDLMDGEIGVHSEIGVGSKFWFTIPFTPEN